MRDILAARLADRPYRHFETTSSTMDVARQWLTEDAPHGALVVADRQTAGRGRLGRPWVNARHVPLAMSLILRLPPAALPQAIMFGALVVLDTVNALGISGAAIKWPNDVLINGRKVSGILVETVWDGARLPAAVLGMGVNVSGSFQGSELAETAISIEDALGHPPDVARVFSLLIDAIDRRMSDFNTAQMVDAWRGRLGMIGARVRIESSASFEGIAEDVADNGALLVRTDDGRLHTVLAGDVRLRPVR